ncbi:AraC family transcriptional regulator [Segetibacter sp. 3557_3]|uniref:AraC family transcriptional regulator n=1 Tax=Segetibacter sp. 3557_3 TaxID=2547429 RepID=UPI0010583E90|nr:helix-turn-helix domain-containing protein [Segetibacter sp. 3557_3]TDH18072.1 AraC family transcriptional regulator [Segetibacter sp. 3557_3]
MEAFQALPQPVLRNNIVSYLNVCGNSVELGSLKQTFFPYHMPALLFCSGEFSCYHSITGTNKQMSVSGGQIGSHYMGLITSPYTYTFKDNEEISVFFVIFQPFGFYEPFRINMSDLTDVLPSFTSLVGEEGKVLNDQLAEVNSFEQKVKRVDDFFLDKCLKSKKDNSQIAEACRAIISNNEFVSMKSLAYQTNMSQSKLERQFTEVVGVTPKMFSRFKRLHRSLCFLNSLPGDSLTKVAYQSGFYDQSHFIKEFKSFTLQTPSSFNPSECFLFNKLVLFSNLYPSC